MQKRYLFTTSSTRHLFIYKIYLYLRTVNVIGNLIHQRKWLSRSFM